MKMLITFMYKGEVSFNGHRNLDGLLKTAEALQIRALLGNWEILEIEQKTEKREAKGLFFLRH